MPRRIRNRRRTRRFVTKTNITTCLSGRETRPKPDIPSVVLTPWYSTTVLVGGTGDTSVTWNSLWITLCQQQQLYYADTSGIQHNISGFIRVGAVRVWNTSGGVIKLIVNNTALGNLVDGNLPRKALIDYPGRDKYAKLGYRWPKPDFQTVHDTAEGREIFAVDLFDSTQSWIGYVDVCWKGVSETVGVTARRALEPHDPVSLLGKLTISN